MEIVRHVVFLFHLIGFAALFGGAFVQIKGPKRQINPAMWHGALTMLVSGLLLVALLEMGDTDLNHMKLGIKLVVLLAIFGCILTQRSKEHVSNGVFFTIFGLTFANAAIAVFV
ncbi:MAG: hypothetical protein E7L00_09025 [Propionibacteriaceae bacterium]|nr:hypothetical protein [Propionibacteriaceae bacterium]